MHRVFLCNDLKNRIVALTFLSFQSYIIIVEINLQQKTNLLISSTLLDVRKTLPSRNLKKNLIAQKKSIVEATKIQADIKLYYRWSF